MTVTTISTPNRYHGQKCVWCGEEINGFADALSAREYTISHLCQECQDKAFADPDEDKPDEDPYMMIEGVYPPRKQYNADSH